MAYAKYEDLFDKQGNLIAGAALPWEPAGACATPAVGPGGWFAMAFFKRLAVSNGAIVTQVTAARLAGPNEMATVRSVADLV